MRKFKYAVILSSTDDNDERIDEENEIRVSHCEVFSSKAKASRAYASWLSGRTNMDVMLLEVVSKQRGELT